MNKGDWQRVSKRRPCPVCGKPDWCLVAGPSDAPEAAICARVESSKRCGEAGWLHVLRDDGPGRTPWRRTIGRAIRMMSQPGNGQADFGKLAADFRKALRPEALGRLVESLGVSATSLSRLGIGWTKGNGGAWTFPMRSGAEGKVTGIRLRLPNGRKLSVKGGKEGLFIPEGLDPGGRLLVCEGPTDSAALLDLGFPAAGRPSCAGGVRHVVDLVRRLAVPELVVVADGDGPGQRGADSLASVLIAYCPTVRIVTPPAGSKDAREWKQRGATAADVQAAIDAAPKLEPRAEAPAAPAGIREPKERADSQATRLVTMADEAGAEWWHTPEGTAFATVRVGRHSESLRIRSTAYRRWLSLLYFMECSAVPGAQAIQDAIGVMEGKAVYDGREYDAPLRVAQHEKSIYIDLCDAEWRAIEVSVQGWRIVENSPVRFRRAKAMLPLPEPTRGGTVDELRDLVNVTDATWPLVATWLLAAMRPRGPYPVLCLHGEQGSAKSTTARALRATVDPNSSLLRSEPKEPRDLMIAAANGWVAAYDNISHLPAWLSDALCRLSTGGGFGTRTLYTDDEETIFDAMRPVILTGIEEVATRSDLLDRALMVNLLTIPETRRMTEEEWRRRFEAAHPAVLGAMLDAVVSAMCRLPRVRMERMPRMADYAVWATAGEPGLGLLAGEFLSAYTATLAAGNEVALESALISRPLRELMADSRVPDWTGTASELLTQLEGRADDRTRRMKGWPQSPRALSGMVKRLAPNLRRAGIGVDMEGSTGRGKSKRKVITLTRTDGDSCDPTNPMALDAEDPAAGGVDGGATGVRGGATRAQDWHSLDASETGNGAGGGDGGAKFPECSNDGDGETCAADTPHDEVVEWTG